MLKFANKLSAMKSGEPPTPRRVKIVAACHWANLADLLSNSRKYAKGLFDT